MSWAGPGVGWDRRGIRVQNARRLPPQGWVGADGHLRVSASLNFASKVPGARHFIYIVSIFSFSSPHYSPITQIKKLSLSDASPSSLEYTLHEGRHLAFPACTERALSSPLLIKWIKESKVILIRKKALERQS